MITKYTSEAALDFHTGTDEVHLHHAQLANFAAMARSIFHQVGATQVAQPELTTLVSFNGTNGAIPAGSLIADAHGDLFGTTPAGAANGLGTVFEIAKTPHGYASTPTTLVSFDGTDGIGPGGLIADSHGNLFGSTAGGGANGDGTMFEIAKTPHGYASTPTTLVSFNGTGGSPNSGKGSLIADAHGNLFGETGNTAFEIVKTAHGYASTETTLVSFNGTGLGNSVGAPSGNLVADSHGDLFGTTFRGGLSGAQGYGSVFEIVKTAHGYASTPTTLVDLPGPTSLVADAHGNLFGTTIRGDNFGTVFEIAKTDSGYASTPTTLVSFNGTDGSLAVSLIADSQGNLFGTTLFGGANGDGTVFEIAKTPHGYASTPTTLVSFNGTNGYEPNSLTAGSHGNLFGTTVFGGAGADILSGDLGDGTMFEITGSGFSTHKTPSSVIESHDHFVFAPNLGENTRVNSNVHDETIDHAKSEFADFAALLAQAHGDGVHQTAHDGTDIMDHAPTLAAQHAHHFLV